MEEVLLVEVVGRAGAHPPGDVLRLAAADKDVHHAVQIGLAVPVIGAEGLKGYGHILPLAHAGHKGQIVNAVLAVARIHIEGVPGLDAGSGPGVGGVAGVEAALVGAGQLREGDADESAPGIALVPEVREVVPVQGDGHVLGGGVEHVQVSGVLLDGDGEDAVKALVGVVIDGEIDGIGAGGVLAGAEADVAQVIGGAVKVVAAAALHLQRAHLGHGLGAENHILGGAPARVIGGLVDLLLHGLGGPAVHVPQGQIGVVQAHRGVGGDDVAHVDRHRAGGADGLGGQAALGHGHDKADIAQIPLLLRHGGGQDVAVPGVDQGALVVPAVGEVVVPGDVGGADAHGHIAQGEAEVRGAQGHVDHGVLRQGDGHLAVVHSQAHCAPAVHDLVGLLVDPCAGVMRALAGVGAVPVVLELVLVVVGVNGGWNGPGAVAGGAGIFHLPLDKAGGAGNFLVCNNGCGRAGNIARAVLVRTYHVVGSRQGRGHQREQHNQRQQQRGDAPGALPFHLHCCVSSCG